MRHGQLRQVAPGAYAWIGIGGDSNAGAVETPHGLLVIDAQASAAAGGALRQALQSATGAPVRALLNTHLHLDHVAGNVAFADVPIIGHAHTLEVLERELGGPGAATVSDVDCKIRLFFGGNFSGLVPATERGWFAERVGGSSPLPVQPPTVAFADRLELRLPADTLRVEHWGPAHCLGDVVVSLERSGVLFLGDLCFNGRFPWLGDCDLDGWIAALDRVLAMDIGIVVPGHGEPTSREGVASFRELLCAIREAAAQALKAGLSEEAAVAEIELPAYRAMPRYDLWMPFNIRAAYRYLRDR
jgi:glyoxylase-like metal-dependent hydrolase (beta-lactamase superfamily II)